LYSTLAYLYDLLDDRSPTARFGRRREDHTQFQHNTHIELKQILNMPKLFDVESLIFDRGPLTVRHSLYDEKNAGVERCSVVFRSTVDEDTMKVSLL